MINLAKIKEDLQAVITEIKGKSDKAMFTLRRVMTALEQQDRNYKEAEKEIQEQKDYITFLTSKITSLEKKIELLKAQLKDKIRR